MAITRFRGEHRFLSNFWPAPVKFDGEVYATVEHAYQASKTTNREDRQRIRNCKTPSQAKSMGKKIDLRLNWEDDRVTTMLQLVLKKFYRGSDLAEMLLETGEQILIEGNDWGDEYWGVCNGKGCNFLGEILMIVRKVLADG